MKNENGFGLLRAKRILSILDGDVDFGFLEIEGKESDIKMSMPYLTGQKLCDISKRFGLVAEYGGKSRWMYLDELLGYCIQKDRMSDLLNYLFSKEQFAEKLRGKPQRIIECAYSKIVYGIIDQINGELCFGDNELVRLGGNFFVQKKGSTITVTSSSVKLIDSPYIVDISERAMKDVSDGNFDSAITKSRTLLEEVFCYVVEQEGKAPSDNGDIGKLYNQVKELYNMHQNKELDKRINGLLSGLEKILSAIAEMRNKGSDSHGVGAKRINIADHHARLFVNSAMTMADFILAVCERQHSNK